MQNVIRLAKRNFIFSEILETAPKKLKKIKPQKNFRKRTFKKLHGDIKKLRRKKTPIG